MTGAINCRINERNGVSYISFPVFEKQGIVHGCSTKQGGVSRGIYASMNLGFKTGDARETVLENHRRFAGAVGYDWEKLVFSSQVHATEVRRVGAPDAGKGILTESDIEGVDGLISNDSGVVLMIFFADCVPLFFYDPVHRAIGASHSGWRGTAGRMGACTAEAMNREFGTLPEDLIVVVGPSICGNCYEVGEDVAEVFLGEFHAKWHGEILKPKGEGKYLLDLWRTNEIVLMEAGVLKEQITVSGLCPCCHSGLLFSHRATGGKRGSLAGAITLGERTYG